MNKVYLVGAGPGDPELLTLKGKRVLALADAVLFDHLANDALLSLAPAGAERVYVGKKKAAHSHPQEEIIRMMIDRARAGQNVVRLKGGDPFIFGRGGEEIEALAEAGIAYEVVPGVTAPLGIAAYTGVPLTHREHTSVVTFVTGHSVEGIDWQRFGTSETLVIFMGIHFVADITGELLKTGRSPDTPAMCVRWGTRPDQQTVVGTIATLSRQIEEQHVLPPATIIVGDVVGLHEKLDWFGKLPLIGQRVVVTRARGQASELVQQLSHLGAEVVELPTIAIVPLTNYDALDAAIARLESYDWLIFTSVNAVEHFLARMDASDRDWRNLRGKLCAIGSATCAALEASHLKVDLVPLNATGEGVAAAFAEINVHGKRILLPRAAEAREIIPAVLSGRGADVEIVDAYRNVVPEEAAELARQVFQSGTRIPDWVTFTSSSTVKNLLALVGPERLAGVKTASIGPVTTNTLRSHGLQVTVEASQPSMEELANAIVDQVMKKSKNEIS